MASDGANNVVALNSTNVIAATEQPAVIEKESPVAAFIKEPVTEKNVKTIYTTSNTASVEAETGRSSYSFVSLHNQAERLKQFAQKKRI